MGAVISRLQLIDRTQLIIGCGTAAVILLYFRIVGKGGDRKFVPKHQKGIHFQQQECLRPCASYPSLPELVSENSFVSVKTALTSSKSSCYPTEEYTYFVITQDAEERTPFAEEQSGTSIPTIQATTLFRSSKSNVETQTCHRDFSHGHTAIPPPEITKRIASTDSTNQNSLATSTQTCHFDTLSQRNTIKSETRSDRRPSTRIRDNNTFAPNTAQSLQPKFKVVQQTSFKHSSGTKARRTQLPDGHSRTSGQESNPGELPSVGTQTCHLHQTPLATRREYHENIFATPPITVSTCLPYASLPAIVPDDDGVDQQSFLPSTPTGSSKGFQLPVRHTDSASSAQTSAVSHQLYQLPEIPVDSLTATAQTEKPKVIATQTSVICHHHYELPEIPVDSLTATTQTEKPNSAIATQTSVVCHHHYELPEIPVDSATATTQTEKPNSAIATQTSVLCHHHYSQPTLAATTQTEKPAPRKAQGSVVCHHHLREATGPTYVTRAPPVQELPESKDVTPTTSRTEPADIPEPQAPSEDSSDSDSDFLPRIIDSKPSMKVEDLKLFEHEPLPEIEPRVAEERPRDKVRPRRAEPRPADNSGLWLPVKTRPGYKTRPKEKGKGRNLVIERKPQLDNQ